MLNIVGETLLETNWINLCLLSLAFERWSSEQEKKEEGEQGEEEKEGKESVSMN